MIHLYPIDHIGNGLPESLPKTPAGFLWEGRDHLFFECGKHAIRHVIRSLHIGRNDEVAILTSSDSTYVSTCVSATIFNFCKISRRLSNHTRAIFVIHEFGVPHPRISELSATARERGIPLIEDCAHTFDSRHQGRRVGTFGDFTIYSLKKHLPMTNGGILVGERLEGSGGVFSEGVAESVQRNFEPLEPYIAALSRARRRHFNWWARQFPEMPQVFNWQDEWTPYFMMFRSAAAGEFYRLFDCVGAEWGRTHVDGWIAAPTQPLASLGELQEAAVVLHDFVAEQPGATASPASGRPLPELRRRSSAGAHPR